MRIVCATVVAILAGLTLTGCNPDTPGQAPQKAASDAQVATNSRKIHLSPGQECVDGVVTLRYKGSAGEAKTRQWLMDGKPVKCSGDDVILEGKQG